MNLRPFDDTDYEAFAGVESVDPMIGEVQIYDDAEYTWDGLIVVDGRTVQLDVHGVDGDDVRWARNFDKGYMAMTFVQLLPDRVRIHLLEDFGFTKF